MDVGKLPKTQYSDLATYDKPTANGLRLSTWGRSLRFADRQQERRIDRFEAESFELFRSARYINQEHVDMGGERLQRAIDRAQRFERCDVDNEAATGPQRGVRCLEEAGHLV